MIMGRRIAVRVLACGMTKTHQAGAIWQAFSVAAAGA